MAAHLLIVEDDPLAREAMAALLGDEGYRVTTAPDGHAALALVGHELPDLVISDVRMPRGDGLELVQRLRARAPTARVPVILVSALAEADRRIAALDLGADDFLAKPVDPGELLARVRVQLRRVDERRELERRALVDPLTGALNRRGIADVLRREVERARRGGGALSVLAIDVDHFKSINDTYGHQLGDTVLRLLARMLTDAVRLADHVGRPGGDEFLVVLPDTTAEAAAALAARLRRTALPALSVGPHPDLVVTVSIGAATLEPDDTLDELLERADQEMYRMKRSGGVHGGDVGDLVKRLYAPEP